MCFVFFYVKKKNLQKSESALSMCLCAGIAAFNIKNSQQGHTSLSISVLMYSKIGKAGWSLYEQEQTHVSGSALAPCLPSHHQSSCEPKHSNHFSLTLALYFYIPTWFWLFCSNSICDHIHQDNWAISQRNLILENIKDFKSCHALHLLKKDTEYHRTGYWWQRTGRIQEKTS